MIKQVKRGRSPVYEDAFKIKVAREYLDSDLGFGRLAAKYNLPSASSVRFFVSWYQKQFGDQDQQQQDAATASDQQGAASLQEPPQVSAAEKDLQKELSAARLKIAALETLIKVASAQTGIDILKKGGAKQ